MELKMNGSTIGEGKFNGEFLEFLLPHDNVVLRNNSNSVLSYYYANDDGVLADYNAIVSLGKGAAFDKLNKLNVAPLSATKIVALNESGTVETEFDLPKSMAPILGNKIYSAGLLSDIHIDGNGDGNNSDNGNSQSDFSKALNFFTNQNVDFVVINGDITFYGYTEDYQAYNNIVSNYSTPIKTIRGNHECYVDYVQDNENTQYQEYIGDSLYYEYNHNGDIYLFCGNAKESSSNLFSDEELTWLAGKLEEYKNNRVFLFVHYAIRPVGFGGEVSTKTGITNSTFLNLIKTYKNIVYFSGHTHLKFNVQELDKNSNIQAADIYCNRVHIPSGTKPKDYSNSEVAADSEGYLMDVYDNGILLKGYDFINNKYVAIAQYFLEI